ncbi:TRAP transporter substrate-binding protein [Virgibacillus ihumii]|uniref:TRAP transporter substrate-binding protein n=1 Tax=Virgibacillus ihumii TaxID=2686091 RepID=UPI00157BD47C|nr:TRAP transporter substrate-binding protein [Virgibacillus ihumii]
MKINRKHWLIITIICLSVIILGACGGDEEADANSGAAKKTFKIGLITDPSHMWTKAAEKFKEEIEKRSEGEMTLEVFPSGQLGNESAMLQQIESGSLDFGFITAVELSSREKAFSAWFAPYLFETIMDAQEASDTDVAKEMLGTLDKYGLLGLDYLFAGQRVMLFKDKKVQGPEDMEGMVLRVTPGPPMLEFYEFTGASTEGMPLTEVYSAAQMGVIDGMDMDLDATITNKYFEVVNYAAVTNHMVWPSVAVVNKDTFESLSEEEQKIIKKSLEIASDYAVKTRSSKEEEFRQTLKDKGMTVYELDKNVFTKQIQKFDEKYKQQGELIKKFITKFRN